ncbi:GNAT family N-acetyltransferase [Nocardioides sp. zg-1228]|uniref:GNAT family N-acetyltransferase n=1 Tax=Nocardioides sp. zg-1228 TaxID=2763008 RepID=UPI0016436586|nr:GNAT family N-acetyltransferase [Nocardioides sp. zg-1228]MBC2931707.1 GNAT family N-acetyltransferase [Nocardioides sp. zg-1228]QSF57295.1 GNAT family N-acetyltransferase [Nocardioides sp. zg-1228]
MHVSSLGFRTDLALLTASGSTVEDRGTHLVVRTPANPTYYWGNFLLLAEAPVPGGEREVVAAFRTEFPEAGHVSIGIDRPDLTPEARAAFEAAGLVVDVASVLTATDLVAPREVDEVGAEVRALQSEEDWESRARLSYAIEDRDDEESHLRFARGRNVQEQLLATAGRGARFGVFVDGEVVSTAAAFTTEEGVARFQSVETHPEHRRKGLAAAAVHAAGRYALDRLGARTLVIVADDDGEAIGVYRRLGFADVERQLMLERRAGGPRTA